MAEGSAKLQLYILYRVQIYFNREIAFENCLLLNFTHSVILLLKMVEIIKNWPALLRNTFVASQLDV